jgi:hypothetical protein
MSSETLLAEQAKRKTSWLTVTVTGLAEGHPPRLGFYWTLILRDGTRRRCMQNARVIDHDLLQRLRAEVKPGDAIRVATVVDKTVPDCPTVLEDFQPT